jgi:D-alanine-D-alanine ligase
VAFDKARTKKRLVEAGVPTAEYEIFNSAATEWPSDWSPPVVLKPVRQGSSVGLRFVEKRTDFPAALAEALQYDDEVLMEEKIVGRETTVGILGESALPIVEVRPRTGVYDYNSKYTSGATEYLCPAPFDAQTTGKIQSAGLGAFRAVGARDYARVDIMVGLNGEPIVLEVNTLPGMTETSLLPKAAAAAGFGYSQLCQRMVELAMRRCSPKDPIHK